MKLCLFGNCRVLLLLCAADYCVVEPQNPLPGAPALGETHTLHFTTGCAVVSVDAWLFCCLRCLLLPAKLLPV